VHVRLAVLPGDGVGPEVTAAGLAVLRAIAERFGHRLECEEGLIGGAAIDATGDPLPAATVVLCKAADAVLLGAVGGPKWAHTAPDVRPEQGLLRLRSELGVYANLRPVVPDPAIAAASPLKPHLLEGVDVCFVRELTGGIYFGEKTREADRASDLCAYTTLEIERVARLAAGMATRRRGKLTSVDKANVLETSRLWRETIDRVMEEEFPGLEVEHLLVDAATMHLMQRPRDFDVIVTENLFGDILTDQASVLAGSMGLLPSASLGDGGPGLFEPIHGSAPDIAGQGVANPCGMIASVALLLRHGLGLETEAASVEVALRATLDAGWRTPDIARGGSAVGTGEFTAEILRRLAESRPALRSA
jgi:3-isopropylmalate dehydrogenase